MTVLEVKIAMEKYINRGLGNLPVGFNVQMKNEFGYSFCQFEKILRIVDDYDGEVILLGPEIKELKKVDQIENEIKGKQK